MADKLALYFGYGSGGHFLRFPDGWRTTLCPEREVPGFPWTIGLLDTGLLKNREVSDQPDGRVHWCCGGKPLWFAFVWWDRSGDKRGASSSGFYVRGFEPAEITRAFVEAAAPLAFAYACEQWPKIVARQLYPLTLMPMPPAAPAAEDKTHG
jgi:hypothetical protein